MGVCCVLNRETTEVMQMLTAGQLPDLSLVHRPVDRDGKPSLWPHGITDGECFGWFEAPNLLHFWGGQRSAGLMGRLREADIRVVEMF